MEELLQKIIEACAAYYLEELDDASFQRVIDEIPAEVWQDKDAALEVVKELVENEDLYEVSLKKRELFAEFIDLACERNFRIPVEPLQMYLHKGGGKVDLILPEHFSKITSAADHGQGTLKLVYPAAHKRIGVFLKNSGQIPQFRFTIDKFSHGTDCHGLIRIIQQRSQTFDVNWILFRHFVF